MEALSPGRVQTMLDAIRDKAHAVEVLISEAYEGAGACEGSADRYRRAASAVAQTRAALVSSVNDLESIIAGSDHHKPGPFEERDRQRVGDEDYNPAANRARLSKATRMAGEIRDGYARRLIAFGFPPEQAAKVAAQVVRVKETTDA